MAKPNYWELTPQYIPATDTPVISVDCHIEEITFSNVTGSDVTVTVLDRQGIPLALFGSVTISANTTYGATFSKGRLMPNGFSWSASAPNAVVAGAKGFYS